MWYEQADHVIALTQEQLLTPPYNAPTLRMNPYPNLPFLDQNDEAYSVKTSSAALLCEVCHKNVRLHSMGTHIARHILLGECARDVCGYCGGHDCTTQLLRNTQGRLLSIIVTNCPLEPSNVRCGAMARGFAQNPCTNRALQCVLCRHTVWLYGMAHHFDSKHTSSAPPSALCVKADEKEMVVNWSGKKNNIKRSHHEMDAEDGGHVAEGPPCASIAPAPHPKRIKSSSSSSSSSSPFNRAHFVEGRRSKVWYKDRCYTYSIVVVVM